MNKSVRKFVLDLKGPVSTYCNCKNPCSRLEIDHVIPIWFLKRNVKRKYLKSAINDPHNLYRCCRKLNGEKGGIMLDAKYKTDERTGLMSRSYLYMTWRYDLTFYNEYLNDLNTMSFIHQPEKFEIKRNLKIAENTGLENPFITHYNELYGKHN